MTRTIFKKYLILLVAYTVILRFSGHYGLKLYYTFAEDPVLLPATILSIQSFVLALEFAFRALLVIIMLVDVKGKTLVDWLIVVITFFNAEAGIILFLVWILSKEREQELRSTETR